MTQAIFLSYASQDADAARHICDALRATGLEVWFDQSELRGGEAWDQSIRKQVKECALFVPMISASTNARSEGYFRLEWKLAVDRSHLMADDQAFFLPVVIDDTAESIARVPDKFRERQWSRLVDEQTVATFANHAKQLLSTLSTSAPSSPAERVPGGADANAIAVGKDRPPHPRSSLPPKATSRRVWLASTVAAIVGALALARWRPWQKSETGASAPGKPALLDPQLQRAQQLIESLDPPVADAVLAEDLVKAVLATRPTDIEATLAMARVQAYFLLRGFDQSEERFAEAKRHSERALALAPTDPEAMAAMATYLFRRGVELPRATKLLRDAIALQPDESRHYRLLNNILAATPGVSAEEIIAAAKVTAERFPQDALAQYDLARHYRNANMLEETERYLDRAILLGQVPNAILMRARLKLYIDGDVSGMKVLLDQVPERNRSTDRFAVNAASYAAASGQIQFGLDALRALSKPWLADFEYVGPTQLLAGELLLLQNKTDIARLRFTEAQAELSRRAAELSRNSTIAWLECWLLMRLGKSKEARARNAQLFSELRRPYRINLYANWIFHPIPLQLLLGERAKALELMREAVGFPNGRTIMRNVLRIDSRLARFRADPEVVALLAEPDTKK